jgi:hypothetical protein
VIAFAGPSSGKTIKQLEARVDALEIALAQAQAAIAALQANNALALGPFVHVEAGAMQGLSGPHVLFEGANVHVRSGGGATDDGGSNLGNLLVGYNERSGAQDRTSTHTLVVGPDHSYSSFGCFVAGDSNTVSAPHAAVSGGVANRATGHGAAVAGGLLNEASGLVASVCGGQQNIAEGFNSAATGGVGNRAAGELSR